MLKNKSTHVFITLVTMFAVQGALAANTAPKQVVADYTRPLSFEANRGQSDKKVDFLAHGTGYGLFLSHANAVMAFEHGTAVRMRPVGANASSQPEPLDPQPSKSNYFIGNVPDRWHTNVPNYAKVRYRSIYPGVDLIYYGTQRQLEYDFVVSAGADPDKILLDFQGASKAKLDRDGNVIMHTTAGDLRWHKPTAYQEVQGSRRFVACAYARKGALGVAFTVGAFDRTKPLIIDPVLEYSTYLGGVGPYSDDEGNAIAVDTHGNAYVTGFTLSTDFPVKNAFQSQNKIGPFSGAFSNAFVTKFDAAGHLVYSTYLGGSGPGCDPHDCIGTETGDSGNGIAVDAHGNAYVTGYTWSSDFPLQDALQTFGFGDAFVTKLCPDGNALVYSTYWGPYPLPSFNPGDPRPIYPRLAESGNAIAVDAGGNAYVAGFTTSSDFRTKDAFQNELKGGTNAFVTKFDAAGTGLVYSTYLGGSNTDSANAIALDRDGNAYVTGQTDSPDFPIRNAFQDQLKNTNGAQGGSNAFVTKFDAAGNALVYSTYLAGSGIRGEAGKGIAVDIRGNAYITGSTDSADFPTKNAFQKVLKSSSGNAFVTKLDRDGDSLVYSSYLGGSTTLCYVLCGDEGHAIAVDRNGEAYVTGVTSSTDFPIKNAFQDQLKNTTYEGNAFVTKFDAAGNKLVYSTYLGGSGGDSGNGIALDIRRNAYITGGTNSADFPTKDAFQPVFGTADAFVTKISAH